MKADWNDEGADQTSPRMTPERRTGQKLLPLLHQTPALQTHGFRMSGFQNFKRFPSPATDFVAICYGNCKTRQFCNTIVFLHLYSHCQSCELPGGSSCVLFHSLAHGAWCCTPALLAENYCWVRSNKRAPEIHSVAAGFLLNLPALAKSPRALPVSRTSKLHSGETCID